MRNVGDVSFETSHNATNCRQKKDMLLSTSETEKIKQNNSSLNGSIIDIGDCIKQYDYIITEIIRSYIK